MTARGLIPCDVASLVIELPSWVGDAVMATPVLRAVRATMPAARIAALMRPTIGDVLAGCPYLDQTIVIDSRGMKGVFAAARELRRLRPEAALLLPNSFRSALAARLGGVRLRVGYARDGRGWLLSGRVARNRQRRPVAAIDSYAELAEAALGCAISDRAVELWHTEEEMQAAERILDGVAEPFLVLNPGANRPDKRWPMDRWSEAGRRLVRERGVTIVVNGAPAERAIVDEVCAAIGGGAINLAARGITLGALKRVLQQAALLITNDTGPRHIAAAVGTPAVVLFGPTDHRWTTLPAARERLLLAEPFLPEERLADDVPALCAIERIPVADVVSAAHDLLEGPAARAP